MVTKNNKLLSKSEHGELCVRDMLRIIGENPEREGLKETPKRVVESWKELYGGYKMDPKKILKTFSEPHPTDQMVVLRDIEFVSMCEHHALPFVGSAHIGYIPSCGHIVGISKLARLLECYVRRLQIQERIGNQVVDALMQHLNATGAGCVISAKHLCMSCRGVNKQHSVMVTSALRGSFMRNPEVRQEFYTMAGMR